MGLFEVDLLDFYFSEQHKLHSPNTGLNFIEKFFDNEIFKDIREKYLDIIEPSLHNLEHPGDKPFQEDLTEVKTAIQQQPRLLSFVLEVLKRSSENIVSMWKSFYYYDEILFENFSKLMDSAKKVDKTALLKIIYHFQKKRKDGLSLLQKIQSTIDISEVKAEASLKIKDGSFTFRDLDSKRWDIIQRLNQKSSDDQQINMHNWCKELGDLIEDQFKRTIYFIFLINNLIKTEKMYKATTNFKFISIHYVLSLFSKHFKKYQNINKLPHYRNSIHHASFTWKSSQPIENSIFRFVDKSWADTISFEQLLLIYFKLVTLVATFEIVVMTTHLSLLDDSKPINQIMKDVGDQLFQASLKPLKEWLDINHQKRGE